MIIENIQSDLVKSLPHAFPFRFVEDVLMGDENIFITEKKAEIFQNQTHHYPKSLLIEHAAQTMFVHGYHIGLANGWWDKTYEPTGFLTGIKDAKFTDYELSPDDYILTKTEVLRICKPMLIVKTTITIFGQIVLFEGIVNGVYTEACAPKHSHREYETGKHVNSLYFKRTDKGTFFDSNNWFLPGHFPSFKCFPGCLMLEGVKQSIHPDLRFNEIEKARFKNVMTPDKDYFFVTKHLNDNRYSFQVIEENTELLCADGVFSVAFD